MTTLAMARAAEEKRTTDHEGLAQCQAHISFKASLKAVRNQYR